ncbi:hypothetical protein AAG906_036842 [Vitis piasezkii]
MTSTTPEDRGEDGPITFPPINSNWVILPHEDAPVLTLGVNDFDVHIILVNPRSSTNLLQMSAYRQMGYSRFNGASIVTLSDVILPIQAESITLNVRFSVVEDLSPYNAIMGRV